MRIAVVVDGETWTGWKSLSVRHSMSQAVQVFSLETTDRQQEGLDRWNIRGGSEIEIYLNLEKVFAGYIQQYNPSISSSDHTISMSGSSYAIDLAECGHLGPYFWPEGTQYSAIMAAVIAPFDKIIWNIDAGLDLGVAPKEGFRVAVNDSPLAIIIKLAEKSGSSVFTDSDGTLRISKNPSAFRGSLQRGDYIEANATHDLEQQFSEVVVKAQKNDHKESSEANFKAEQQIEKRVQNGAETRYRPAVFVSNGEAGSQDSVAEFIRDRLYGLNAKASFTVKSIFDKDGALWNVNTVYNIYEPLLDISGINMLVQELEFSVSEGSGLTVKLDVTSTAAFSYQAENARERRLAARSGGDGIFNRILAAVGG